MATNYTTLLGFALPTTGELSGTWGEVVNNNITELVEDAIAGSATASVTSANWTLTTTGSGEENQARSAILIPTGTPGTSRDIIAPSASKAYIVDNQSNGAVVVKASGTTGATVAAGTAALVVWDGSDFVLVAQDLANAQGTLAVANGGTGVTTSTGSGNVVLSTSPTLTTPNLGTPSAATLTNAIGLPIGDGTTGTLSVARGGSGATTAATARTNLGLGTAATTDATDYATAAQGDLADTALQPADVGTIASQNANNVSITGGSVSGITDLAVADGGTGASTAEGARTNLGLGTAATTDATDYATAAQGDLADTALQPADVGTIASQNSNDVSITGGSITGITDLAVADGGTGSSTAAGARTNLGLGSIATQNANNVNIDGGAIDGTPIGGTTASTGAFTNFTASGTAEFTSTGAVVIPVGTEAQRPTPAAGMLRFNDDLDEFEGYNGTAWVSVGSSAIRQAGFFKADPTSVAFTKTGAGTAEIKAGTLVGFPDGSQVAFTEDTAITMPTLAVGTDYAIWVNTDGTIQATTNHTSPPATGSRKIGGFHYAPGGNAVLDPAGNWANHTGGNNTPQINEYSFYDLKWKPSAPDPRGLTLVNNSFWVGMYLMSATTTVAPLHKYNVNPARDGNPPQKPYGDGTTYGNARPMNIFECLAYYGFRAPNHNEFQLLALGTTEQTSPGGSSPGNTGVLTSGAGTKERFTSAWGVFDATGVLFVWGRDSLPDGTQDSNVTEGRSNNIWRISRFARFGGRWDSGANSGSRCANTDTASVSRTGNGGRGVADHIVLA